MQTKESITSSARVDACKHFAEQLLVVLLLLLLILFYFIFVAPQTTETTTPNYTVLGCYKPVCFSSIHTHPSAVSSTKQILYDVCVPALFYYAAF